MERNKWLTVEEAAKVAGIGLRTMYRRVAEREIPYHREGRKLLINADDLARYIEARKVPARRAS
jgi:excisionase family DNA binding protein